MNAERTDVRCESQALDALAGRQRRCRVVCVDREAGPGRRAEEAIEGVRRRCGGVGQGELYRGERLALREVAEIEGVAVAVLDESARAAHLRDRGIGKLRPVDRDRPGGRTQHRRRRVQEDIDAIGAVTRSSDSVAIGRSRNIGAAVAVEIREHGGLLGY